MDRTCESSKKRIYFLVVLDDSMMIRAQGGIQLSSNKPLVDIQVLLTEEPVQKMSLKKFGLFYLVAEYKTNNNEILY